MSWAHIVPSVWVCTHPQYNTTFAVFNWTRFDSSVCYPHFLISNAWLYVRLSISARVDLLLCKIRLQCFFFILVLLLSEHTFLGIFSQTSPFHSRLQCCSPPHNCCIIRVERNLCGYFKYTNTTHIMYCKGHKTNVPPLFLLHIFRAKCTHSHFSNINCS